MKARVFLSTIALLITAGPVLGRSRRRKANGSVYDRKRTCEKEECGHLVPLEAQNCVNECVSANCYGKTFKEPLEDGEVNAQLARTFMACARRELKASTKRRPRRQFNDRSPAASNSGDGYERESVVLAGGEVVVEDVVENAEVNDDGVVLDEEEDEEGDEEDGEDDDEEDEEAADDFEDQRDGTNSGEGIKETIR